MHAGAAAAPDEPPVKCAEEASTAAPVAATATAPQPLAHENSPPIVPDSEVRSVAKSRSHEVFIACCVVYSRGLGHHAGHRWLVKHKYRKMHALR